MYDQYQHDPYTISCYAGWRRYEKNPVVGGPLGECFDMCVLKMNGKYRMYFSWRSKKSIAYVDSNDGFTWSEDPVIVLAPRPETGWEDDVNRHIIVFRDGLYHMWYSGQTIGSLEGNNGDSWIGYCTSNDGVHWDRRDEPVMRPEQNWEFKSLMCPHVIWDEEEEIYKMWYSGGQWFEPNAIGYATSKDGVHWDRHPDNPIFEAIYENLWERERTTACQVIKMDGWYYMFYIGFENVHKPRICFARSRDGITNWERHKGNPIIGPSWGWEGEAIYKPFLVYEEENDRWLLWYNGRSGAIEQIGVAVHPGKDLGF